MELILTILHVIVAFFIILVVLVQGGSAGGIGAALGGGNSQGVFGASGATSFLGKLTYWAAGIFMCTSLALAVVKGKAGSVGLEDKLQTTEAPATDSTSQPDHEENSAGQKPDDHDSEDHSGHNH